jgi:hypothetical protein
MNNTITYQHLKDTLTKNKTNQHLSDLVKFFLSKPPEYWSQKPEEVYAIYTDLLEIENALKDNV